MPCSAATGSLSDAGTRQCAGEFDDQTTRRAAAVLGRFLKRLGATRVRTTFMLIRFAGVDANQVRPLCAEAAGETRFYLALDDAAYLIVDIGPRRARNVEQAERDIIDLMVRRLTEAIGHARTVDGAPPRVFVNAVHTWNVELVDLTFVIRQLLAAPPQQIPAPA